MTVAPSRRLGSPRLEVVLRALVPTADRHTPARGIRTEGITTQTSEGAAATTPGPTTRQYAYGVGFITVALAVAVGTPAWLLVASRTCGCTQPPDLVLDNGDARPVTVTVSHAGVFGTPLLGHSESTRVEACSNVTMTLPAGAVHLEIASATAVGELDLEVPHLTSAGQPTSFVVRDGGTVDRVWGPAGPGEPGCR